MTMRIKRTRKIEVRLSDAEYNLLQAYAESKQQPMSEVLRDYIKSMEGKVEHINVLNEIRNQVQSRAFGE